MSRGQAPARAIPMTSLQRSILEQESRKRTTTKQFSTRTQLLLKASQGQSINQTARDLSLSVNTVKAWRARWQDQYARLCAYEEAMPDQGLRRHDYRHMLLSTLRDLPRSGTRKRISLEEEQQLIALASEKPVAYGIEMTDWTHQMLAKVAMAEGIVKQISSRHVGNILKKTSCSLINHPTGSFPESKTGKASPLRCV